MLKNTVSVTPFPLLSRLVGKPITGNFDTIPFNRLQMLDVLESTDPALDKELYAYSSGVTKRFVGDKVWFRGIIEFSNVCEKS